MNAFQYLGLYFSRTYLRDRLLTRKSLSSLFSMIGVVLLIVRLISYLPPTVEKILETYVQFWTLLVLATILTLINRRPESKITQKLNGLDVFITIRVDDVIIATESCVISTNTTFETGTNLIAKDSLQGQFTRTFYDDESHLDTDLEKALRSNTYEELSRTEDVRRKMRKYPLGTVARVNPKGRNFYLLAMANMNHSGNAETSFNLISDALNSLWQFLGRSGDYERELLIPVIGTGRGRITESREEVIHEIIDSFIAASTQKRICDVLSIVIHPTDFFRFNLKMEDLKQYLDWQCRYSRIRRSPGGGTGES